jgi:hypothetical protein
LTLIIDGSILYLNQTPKEIDMVDLIKEIEKAKSKKRKGWVMSGFMNNKYDWFERWFETKDKALNYAAKRNWTTEII